ncbi:MAG: FAD-binding oxidoreductase, partial [Balneolales bacterium]|nr:FAD-binding oxidoreductase [Balneolales bacterium]
ASGDLKEALDLCLSCKACKSECPANVDMAKMKAEFSNGWQKQHGVTNSEWFFGNAGKLYPMASRFPFISNTLTASALGKGLLKYFFNVSPKRDLPKFAKQPFHGWFKNYEAPKKKKKVLLLADVFTNYHEPQIAVDAIKTLEYLGFQVMVSDVKETGRPQISKGLLSDAKEIANECIEALKLSAQMDIPIIGLEPSEILTLRDEFADLVDDSKLEIAQKIAANTFTFEEFVVKYLDRISILTDEKLIVHNHCHSKALIGNGPLQKALEAWGFEVEVLDSGCCGMAGSFGYEHKNYDISMQIGEQRLFPAIQQTGENSNICAPGFSCRHQIKDGTGKEAYHPATFMARLITHP